jgi:hypothetical protein
MGGFSTVGGVVGGLVTVGGGVTMGGFSTVGGGVVGGLMPIVGRVAVAGTVTTTGGFGAKAGGGSCSVGCVAADGLTALTGLINAPLLLDVSRGLPDFTGIGVAFIGCTVGLAKVDGPQVAAVTAANAKDAARAIWESARPRRAEFDRATKCTFSIPFLPLGKESPRTIAEGRADPFRG